MQNLKDLTLAEVRGQTREELERDYTIAQLRAFALRLGLTTYTIRVDGRTKSKLVTLVMSAAR